MNYKRKDLLKLPEREWSMVSEYDSIILVPTGKKHDSGYHIIAIVGVRGDNPIEIAAYCDDICYAFPLETGFNSYYNGFRDFALRTDMYYPSGITHVWSGYFTFRVGRSSSSTDVYLIPRPNEKEAK